MNYALIFAGGIGQRMNTLSLPKQFLKVHGKEIIVHTIEHFQNCNNIDGIVVVCLEDFIQFMNDLKTKYNLNKIVSIVKGGKTGQESIFNGLNVINDFSNDENDIVLIHDGVRPMINVDLINQNIECVKKNGNCITVAKAIETILLSENNEIKDVVDRTDCYLGRAPQSFYFKDIYGCHLKANEIGKNDFIDSATMMKYYEYELYTVIGPDNNIKVTTPMDYYLFKAMLDEKENEQIKVIE